ncbi:MAG: UDP-N-acetylglucosamine--LPS N-acetylglucosamine transferase [Clostridia bacterium]|nr:UDP-N-acetylglucosamine--LPS N-acetylglucosamine transferase [Clostridia bacterium]
MKVLFLSASTGSGHIRAAEAIIETIFEGYPDSESLVVDSLKYINPLVDKLVVGGYLTAVRSSPKIYKKIYEKTESNEIICNISKALNMVFSLRIYNLVKETKPSAIVCTHPFPLHMLSAFKRKALANIPIISVITDFVSHSFWINSHSDIYIVANEYLQYDLKERGIPSHKVFPYGIPVSQDFIIQRSRCMILKELELEDRFTVLVMGGSLGIGDIVDTFKALLCVQRDIQIVAVCGQNHRLKKELESMSTDTVKSVKILGYTNNISDLMEISDLIITKPGGMTAAEALVKQLPMLIISPIPGQEEGNADFLVKSGAAQRLDGTDNISSVIEKMFDNPLLLKGMRQSAAAMSKPSASKDIARLIYQLSV